MQKTNPQKTSGHDAPIQTAEEDLLNSLGMARAVHRVISTTPTDWSTRIGLYGVWGSGKTSILNLLRTLEEGEDSLVISFSAWAATGESSVIAQFYETLAHKLREQRVRLPFKQRAKAIVGKVSRVSFLGRLSRLGIQELSPVPPLATKVATEALSNLASAATSWGKISRSDLEAIATLRRGRRVVVFIDDLDRADPKIIPKTLLAMRELLDWPGFSFVLAFDKRAISSALSEYSTAFGADAQGFLEKVIDVPFEVPDTTGEQRQRLAEVAFKACCDLMPLDALAAIRTTLPAQPRRLKLVARMIGALRPSLARHSSEDVDWIGIAIYLVLKEASQAVADWVVKAVTTEETNWILWASEDGERRKKEDEARKHIKNLLATPRPPMDEERVVNAAIQLLRHWEMTASATVQYWVELAYREPSITMNEFRALCEDYSNIRTPRTIDIAIRRAAEYAGIAEAEAAADCATLATSMYQSLLSSMAEARTTAEWNSRLLRAEKSFAVVEHLWSQHENQAIATATSLGTPTATLIGVVGTWASWTRNEGESSLRQREQDLALSAAERCVDPELLFLGTDPFWNASFSESRHSATSTKEWRIKLRSALAPRIALRLCEKFLLEDGLLPISSGEDQLGPWFFEKSSSPLYTQPELTAHLIETLQSGADATEFVRTTLSKNSRLFLQQLLFQTRRASWGGVEDARTINKNHPELIPAGWAAVIDVPAPFRMQASLRKLREDLLEIGVPADRLLEPSWLTEYGQADTTTTDGAE